MEAAAKMTVKRNDDRLCTYWNVCSSGSMTHTRGFEFLMKLDNISTRQIADVALTPRTRRWRYDGSSNLGELGLGQISVTPLGRRSAHCRPSRCGSGRTRPPGLARSVVVKAAGHQYRSHLVPSRVVWECVLVALPSSPHQSMTLLALCDYKMSISTRVIKIDLDIVEDTRATDCPYITGFRPRFF